MKNFTFRFQSLILKTFFVCFLSFVGIPNNSKSIHSSHFSNTEGILEAEANAPCNGQIKYEFYDSRPTNSTVDNIPTTGALSTGLVSDFDVNDLQNTVDPGDTDVYSIRYSGSININTAGNYTFYTNSDDGSKLFIDGIEVVNNDGDHAPAEQNGSINLSSGSHKFTVLFYENGGGAVLEVSYSGPSISKQFIPFSILSCD